MIWIYYFSILSFLISAIYWLYIHLKLNGLFMITVSDECLVKYPNCRFGNQEFNKYKKRKMLVSIIPFLSFILFLISK